MEFTADHGNSYLSLKEFCSQYLQEYSLAQYKIAGMLF